MRRLAVVTVLLFELGVGLGVVAAQAPTVKAFVDVSVIPMDREWTLLHQTVVVRGGRIVAVGPVARVAVPAGAMQIDGRGKFLIPSLGDMHVHLFRDSPELMKIYLANGITTVREMFGSSI